MCKIKMQTVRCKLGCFGFTRPAPCVPPWAAGPVLGCLVPSPAWAGGLPALSWAALGLLCSLGAAKQGSSSYPELDACSSAAAASACSAVAPQARPSLAAPLTDPAAAS